MSNIIVMAFTPRNIVGCLLKKRLTKGESRAPQDPHLATPLVYVGNLQREGRNSTSMKTLCETEDIRRQLFAFPNIAFSRTEYSEDLNTSFTFQLLMSFWTDLFYNV